MAFREKPGTGAVQQMIVRLAQNNPQAGGAELAAHANFRATELAAQAGISLRQLQRRFKSEFGVPPKRWLQERRMEIARGLTAKGLRAKQIARDLGFTDASHFLKAYKAHTNSKNPPRKKRSAT